MPCAPASTWRRQRGAFPAIKGSIYDPKELHWQPPTPLNPYENDWGRPAVDWEGSCGRHPAARHSQRRPDHRGARPAPSPPWRAAKVMAVSRSLPWLTSAMSMIMGNDLQLDLCQPAFRASADPGRPGCATRQAFVEHVMEHGTCQGVDEVPEAIRHVFVVSQDISADEHVRMQAALQAFVDNSLSQDGQLPRRRQRGGCGHGLSAGLGIGLQGHHGLCDRLSPEGGAGDESHRPAEEELRCAGCLPRCSEQLSSGTIKRSPARGRCTATRSMSARRWARPS